jgi:hypothetical protein
VFVGFRFLPLRRLKNEEENVVSICTKQPPTGKINLHLEEPPKESWNMTYYVITKPLRVRNYRGTIKKKEPKSTMHNLFTWLV